MCVKAVREAEIGRTAWKKKIQPGDYVILLTSSKCDFILFHWGGTFRSTTGVPATHTSIRTITKNCLELYLSTSDNLVSSMVRVIKWHINIKVYNTVTLSFIASVNPQRQTSHPSSDQMVSLRCLAVLNTFSSSTSTSVHSFIFPSRLIRQLASNFLFPIKWLWCYLEFPWKGSAAQSAVPNLRSCSGFHIKTHSLLQNC